MPIFEHGRAIPVKSRVKIWFELVESFKSYRGNVKKKNNNNNKTNLIFFGKILFRVDKDLK